MNILISVNKQYIEPAKVMLTSLRMNTVGEITVYLLNHSLGYEDITALKQYLMNRLNIDMISLDMNISLIEKLPVRAHFSTEMYYRIIAQYVLPDTLDRILWLDADIIINGDISVFYNQDFNDMCLVVCANGNPNEEIKKKMGIKKEHIYFNSGVLLINLEKLRDYRNMDEILKVCESVRDKLVNPDQDILNLLYQGQVKYADEHIYNWQIHAMKEPLKPDVKIIHYTGPNKPWDVKAAGREAGKYWRIKAENGGLAEYAAFTIKRLIYAGGRAAYKILMR